MAPFGHNVAPPVSVRPAGAVASGTNPRQSSTASKDVIRSQECSEIKPLADLPCPARVDYLFSVEELQLVLLFWRSIDGGRGGRRLMYRGRWIGSELIPPGVVVCH